MLVNINYCAFRCNSTVLAKLLPLWRPVFFAYNMQLQDHVQVRLQAIQDYKPTTGGVHTVSRGLDGGGYSQFL